ncbi:Uncharacterized conserved protein YdaU, DUF1376 family [Bartonella apis]|uniref:YdaU family protein n=1 Tax=Bartonella apis TaxID=1686310 RepID=UPI000959F6C0|nr:DUF1376 domain-containing protein [Bartonella apis]OLY45079.1 Uncharacterized conserved protein YdaU, DUF1376 family [Bartonella apis]
MTNAPFMQLYVADYLADTQHLTTEQHGAYLLLLMTMWRNAGSLPNDEKKLARIAHVSMKRWHIIAGDVMAFFDITDDRITQKRLSEELQKAVSKSEKRKTSGSLGGKAKSLKNNERGLANASVLLKHSSEPDIRNIKRDTNVSQKKGCRLPDDFQPDFSFATNEGFSQDEARTLFESFKDYWTAKTGKDATKRDWQATWRNWVRSPYNRKLRGFNHAKSREERKSAGRQFAEAVFDICDRQGLDPHQPIVSRDVSSEVSGWGETDGRADREHTSSHSRHTGLAIVASNPR